MKVCKTDDTGVWLQNLTLRAPPNHDQSKPGITVKGGLTKGLHLRNVTLEGYGTGFSLSALNCECAITFDDVVLVGDSGSIGVDMALPNMASVTMSHVKIAGYHTAIQVRGTPGDAPHFQAEGLTISCIGVGLHFQKPASVSLHHSAIRDCSGTGLVLENNRGPLLLMDTILADNGLGIWLTPENTGAGSTLQASNISLVHNGAGIEAQFTNLDVVASRFIGNGGVGSKENDLKLKGGVFATFSPGSISGSSFVGNAPAGFSSTSNMFDARGNWWGSPLGPDTMVQGQRVGAGGDVVTGTVLVAPFLTQSP